MTTSTFAASPSQLAVTRSVKLLMGMADESRQALAAALGITPSALAQKLNGRIRWSVEDFDQLVDHYGLRLAELVDPEAAARIGVQRLLADSGTVNGRERSLSRAYYALAA